MYKKILTLVARWCTEHHKKVFAITIFITLILGSLAATLDLNLSFLAVLPDNDKEAQFFEDITNRFGSSSDLVLAVRAKDKKQAIAFIETLAPKIQKLENIRSVDYKVDLDFVEKYGILFVKEKELDKLLTIMDFNQDTFTKLYQDLHLIPYLTKLDAFLKSITFRLRSKGENPTKKETLQLLKAIEGGIDLLSQYAKEGSKISETQLRKKFIRSIGADVDKSVLQFLQGGYYISKDESVMLMFVRTNTDILRMNLGEFIYADINEVTQKHVKKFPGLKANYTGLLALGYEDQTNVLKRFRWLSGLSLLFVILLFFYISRLKVGPILIGVPLIAAMIWTFGIVKIGLGFVSLTSVVFAVLLFGLGIDFAIHLMMRFNEEFEKSKDPKHSIEQAIICSGKGIITGGLTTAFAFFSSCITNYKPAFHLGFTTGWGLVCCLITMMTLFPALLYYFYKKEGAMLKINTSQENKVLNSWIKFVVKYPKTLLIFSIVLTLFFGYQLKNARMEYDLEKITSKNMTCIEVKELISKKFGYTNEYLMVQTDNLHEERKLVKKLKEKTSDDGTRKLFAKVLAVSNFIPEKSVQKRRLSKIAKIHTILQKIQWKDIAKRQNLKASEIVQIARIFSKLKQELSLVKMFMGRTPQIQKRVEKLIMKITSLLALLKDDNEILAKNLGDFQYLWATKTAEFIKRFQKMTQPFLNQKKKIITLNDLPESARAQFISKDKKSFLILAYPKNPSLDRENILELKKALHEIAPGKGTGMMIISEKFVSGGMKEFPLISGVVLLSMLIILILDLRSMKYLILTLFPLGLSAIISMGIICMSGATISILMISAFPLIFGIGIDDGVHIVHRYKESKDITSAVNFTGKAIFMTTLTTMVSFGALIFTNHHGLIGMGLLIGIGITLCFIFSVTILPIMLILTEKRED